MNFIWSLFWYLSPKPKSGDYRRGGWAKKSASFRHAIFDAIFEYVSLTFIFLKIFVSKQSDMWDPQRTLRVEK